MYKMLSGLLGIAMMFGANGVLMADDFPALKLGKPIFNGEGCTKEDTEVALTEDRQTLSVLFSKYVVQAQGTVKNQRKKCDIRIPVTVPAGYSISIIQSEYRGYNFLPRGASATLAADYFLVGSKGPQYKWNFPDTRFEDSTPDNSGRVKGEFYRKADVQASSIVWGPCGRDTTISIKSSLDVTTNRFGEQSDSQLDSLDVTTTTPVLYKLTYRRCTM